MKKLTLFLTIVSHFVDMANGSAFEVETQLYLALDLEYITQEEFDKINTNLLEIERMMYNFLLSLRKEKKIPIY